MLTVPIPGGGTATQNVPYWKLLLHLNLTNGVLNDRMLAEGSIQHVVAPHLGEASEGTPLPYKVQVSADTSVTGTVTKTDISPAMEMPHRLQTGQLFHDDLLRPVTLNATVNGGFFLDDIIGFQLGVHAVHTPEPSTFLMAVSGLGCLLVLLLRKNLKQRDTHSKDAILVA